MNILSMNFFIDAHPGKIYRLLISFIHVILTPGIGVYKIQLLYYSVHTFPREICSFIFVFARCHGDSAVMPRKYARDI